MIRFSVLPVLLLSLTVSGRAEQYKSLPPAGIEIKATDRQQLTDRVASIDQRMTDQAESSGDDSEWVPDVEVLVRAVRLALSQNIFYKPQEVKAADGLLDEADRRLKAVANGKRGLELIGFDGRRSKEPTLAVGGFRSAIDGSVQPYGLVVPAGYRGGQAKSRLDVWLHGRGDNKTEISFLTERMTKVGEYAPANTFVLHPFGRHCVAFKFAGETDVYESIAHIKTRIPIDESTIAMRGFSMGGAGVWHLAVHNPSTWFAANPGAGFVDTIVYQGWDKKPPFEITDTRRKLLNWYDVLPWATNLQNTRLVAYSGEVDKQRQAAERVTSLLRESNIDHRHIIGKDMGHKTDDASKKKIDSMLSIAAKQQTEAMPPTRKIDFVTYFLRYNKCDWLSVEGLTEQFTRGHVVAEIQNDDRIEIQTDGVTRLRLNFADSGWPDRLRMASVTIDSQTVDVTDGGKAPGLQCELYRDGEAWKLESKFAKTARKRPGMQGPIDDAFCSPFVFVMPSRPATHGAIQRWIKREMDYAGSRWQTLMRGDARFVQDTDVTDAMIRDCNLVCFGDFTSNRYLAAVADQLPIGWTKSEINVGDATYDPATHLPAFCFPNPKNPDRYVVVNSGMTFREFSNVSNSRQIAMLPDWVIFDVTATDDGIFPGNVVADGFFDEQWNLQRDETAND